MRRTIFFMAFVIFQLIAMTAVAQNLQGKWALGEFVSDMGDGVEMHLSGTYAFESESSVKAGYTIIGTMKAPENDKDIKSIYFQLLIDGAGKYSMSDSTLNITLENPDKSFKWGEGTFDNMGPAYDDNNPKGGDFLHLYFTALTDMLANSFNNISISDITKNGNVMEGTLMGEHITLTRIEQ